MGGTATHREAPRNRSKGQLLQSSLGSERPTEGSQGTSSLAPASPASRDLLERTKAHSTLGQSLFHPEGTLRPTVVLPCRLIPPQTPQAGPLPMTNSAKPHPCPD